MKKSIFTNVLLLSGLALGVVTQTMAGENFYRGEKNKNLFVGTDRERGG